MRTIALLCIVALVGCTYYRPANMSAIRSNPAQLRGKMIRMQRIDGSLATWRVKWVRYPMLGLEGADGKRVLDLRIVYDFDVRRVHAVKTTFLIVGLALAALAAMVIVAAATMDIDVGGGPL